MYFKFTQLFTAYIVILMLFIAFNY